MYNTPCLQKMLEEQVWGEIQVMQKGLLAQFNPMLGGDLLGHVRITGSRYGWLEWNQNWVWVLESEQELNLILFS